MSVLNVMEKTVKLIQDVIQQGIKHFSVMVNVSPLVMMPGKNRFKFWMSKDVFLNLDFSMI